MALKQRSEYFLTFDFFRITAVPSPHILRGFFDTSRSRFGNPSRSIEETSKKERGGLIY